MSTPEIDLSTIFERHPNGKGKVGLEAEVTRDVFLDEHSMATDAVEIYGGHFESTTVQHFARIWGGQFFGSNVGGMSVITGGTIRHSDIECSSIGGQAYLNNVVIRQQAHNLAEAKMLGARVWDNARVVGVRLYGDVTVFGDAYLHGNFSLTGRYRIHRGEWKQPPKFHDMDWCTLTECTDGHVNIGCKCFKIETWLKRGDELREKHYPWLTDEQIGEARAILESWR